MEKHPKNPRTRSFRPVIYALLAALFFGLNAPFSKLLVSRVDPLFLAALLYLGAGTGMFIVRSLGKRSGKEAPLSSSELPLIIGMILLDIAAPISLMFGIKMSNASTASLLGNFEIVTTALFAFLFFKENTGRRMWFAIGLILAASLVLSLTSLGELSFSPGALLVLLSCLCWGIENNLTKKLSIKDPLQVVVLKGFGSGAGALIIALAWGSLAAPLPYILLALLLGCVAYGASIYFYVRAQRSLGASRTSAYYAAAPFIGVLLSFLILRESVSPSFVIALVLMLAGVGLAFFERHSHAHVHPSEVHDHRHSHDDGHHDHVHSEEVSAEHSHLHEHQRVNHSHQHTPDIHHQHAH